MISSSSRVASGSITRTPSPGKVGSSAKTAAGTGGGAAEGFTAPGGFVLPGPDPGLRASGISPTDFFRGRRAASSKSPASRLLCMAFSSARISSRTWSARSARFAASA